MRKKLRPLKNNKSKEINTSSRRSKVETQSTSSTNRKRAIWYLEDDSILEEMMQNPPERNGNVNWQEIADKYNTIKINSINESMTPLQIKNHWSTITKNKRTRLSIDEAIIPSMHQSNDEIILPIEHIAQELSPSEERNLDYPQLQHIDENESIRSIAEPINNSSQVNGCDLIRGLGRQVLIPNDVILLVPPQEAVVGQEFTDEENELYENVITLWLNSNQNRTTKSWQEIEKLWHRRINQIIYLEPNLANKVFLRTASSLKNKFGTIKEKSKK